MTEGRMQWWCLAGALAAPLGLASAAAVAAVSPDAYLHMLEERAAERHVAASAEWRALGHYEADWLDSGVHSTVASDGFFLSPDGRRDPAAELDATLAGLFSDEPLQWRNKPAGCVFVARRKFLVSALDIDTDRLADIDCRDYRQWRAALSPEKISLVFPTAFPNSPSSMFGHTLLRIDSTRRRRATELLSYAVNFAAAAGDDNHGLLFAFKGLTGGYFGVFGLFPYYEKVKQYAWIEHRDVWSYPLKLTAAQTDRLVDHLWEMDSVRFDYYFFTKNCAYQLLSLLEVARPDLRLTEQYSWYAIPADTIRTLADVPGLMGTPTYRPSLETTLRWQAGQLTDDQRALAQAVAADRVPLDSPRLATLAPADRAAVLEVAHDYLYYQLQSEHATAEAGQGHANAILAARSHIHRPSPFARVPEPATPPDRGHHSLRFALSGIYANDNLSFGVRLRPAYHGLLDDPGGYTDGAAVNVLDAGLQIDADSADVRLHDLTILDITSLSPRSELFKPVSFSIDTGLRRRPSSRVFDAAPNDLGYYLQGGPGLAWGDDDVIGYVFGQGSLDANPGLQPGYALGAGASLGVLAHEAPGYQFRAEAGWLEYVAGADGGYRWAELAQQLPLTRGLALRATLGWEDTAVSAGLRGVLGLQAYF